MSIRHGSLVTVLFLYL